METFCHISKLFLSLFVTFVKKMLPIFGCNSFTQNKDRFSFSFKLFSVKVEPFQTYKIFVGEGGLQ